MKRSFAIFLGTATAAAAVVCMPIHAQDRESGKSEAVTYKPPLRGAPPPAWAGHAQHGQCPRRERARTERHRVDDPGKADHLLVRLAAGRQAGRADHHQHREPAGRRDAGVRDHAAAAAREGHSRVPAGRPRRRSSPASSTSVRRGGAQPGAALERRARRRNDQAGDDSQVPAQLKQASPAQLPALYAEAGIWYDAIDQLSKQISADQSNRQLRERRAALLEQVGLREAAAFDRGS